MYEVSNGGITLAKFRKLKQAEDFVEECFLNKDETEILEVKK